MYLREGKEGYAAMTTILVTGGTGTLGRAVIARLVARRYRVRALVHQGGSSPPGSLEVVSGDLASGRGLGEAVAEAHTIIHCASACQDAQHVDVEGTRFLLEEAWASGASHLIYPSIVGIDRSSYAYYQAKHATERLIEQGPLPWTIARITQFHDYMLWLILSFEAGAESLLSIPAGMRFQSIDVGEVADYLVSLVEQGPGAYTPPIGGPQVLAIEEMAEIYLRVRGKKATIHSEASREELFQVFRSGINLVPEHAVGAITWEAFLRHRYTLECQNW
jgi:uncharacterized protein YbjT (DUF2867 family)